MSLLRMTLLSSRLFALFRQAKFKKPASIIATAQRLRHAMRNHDAMNISSNRVIRKMELGDFRDII